MTAGLKLEIEKNLNQKEKIFLNKNSPLKNRKIIL